MSNSFWNGHATKHFEECWPQSCPHFTEEKNKARIKRHGDDRPPLLVGLGTETLASRQLVQAHSVTLKEASLMVGALMSPPAPFIVWSLRLDCIYSALSNESIKHFECFEKGIRPCTVDLNKTLSFKWHVIYCIVKYFIVLYNPVLRAYSFYTWESIKGVKSLKYVTEMEVDWPARSNRGPFFCNAKCNSWWAKII